MKKQPIKVNQEKLTSIKVGPYLSFSIIYKNNSYKASGDYLKIPAFVKL